MAYSKSKAQQEKGCIELITCVPATPEERANPRYIPQLAINKKAQEIIAERFEAPISIIVFVGNMGVGKSKLATLTVATLDQEQTNHSLALFQSGGGTNGLTQGVWMWTKPLPYPKKKGSIMILDCEGMGDLDENTGANLYLFCMLMSTTFAVVLRPCRVDRDQSKRLYHALRRFENIKSRYVLPNVFLVASDLNQFVKNDRNSGNIPISKEEWIENIFKVDELNTRLSTKDTEELREQYRFILHMLPKIDAVNISRLPEPLLSDGPSTNIYSLLRNEECEHYFKSLKSALKMLLSTCGKRLPGSNAENLYVRPAELAKLMGDLVKIINEDREPKTDALVDRYLTSRFSSEIEKEYMARYQRDLLKYATEVLCEELNKLERPQNDIERANMDERFKKYHIELRQKCFDTMICLTRCHILGCDSSLRNDFNDDHEREQALHELPSSIQHRLNILQIQMENVGEAEKLIERTRINLTIKDLTRQTREKEALLVQIHEQLTEKRSNLTQEKRINQSLARAQAWRVGVAPCRCGAPGKSYNMIHIYCDSDSPGNLYYYNNESNRMVCDACRNIISCRPEDARCTTCQKRLRVTRVF